MARSPVFYWARLRKASVPEILHRLREKVFVELLRCPASGWSPAVPKVSPEFLASLRFPEIYTEPGTGTLNPAVPVHGLDSASREKEEVLLLDKEVRNRSVPLMLSAEDEIEGHHAVSAGRLDEAKLFYL